MRLRARLVAVLAAAGFTAGCATVGPPQPPSLELPKPPLDLRATRKGNRVVLTWTAPTKTTDKQRVRSLGATRICRAANLDAQCGTPVGETAPVDLAKNHGQKLSSTFTDTLPAELQHAGMQESIAYAVEVTNSGGRAAGLSNVVKVPVIETLAPPADFRADVTDKGVELSWGPGSLSSAELPALRYVYRVFRRPLDSQKSIPVGQVPLSGEARTSLLDQSFEWGRTYLYHIEVVSLSGSGNSEQQVEGENSPEIKVFADDVFPPAVPSGLQAAFSGPGQQPFIDLIWAPVTDLDLEGYNVYRHEAGAAPVKLNASPLHTPSYRDADVKAGTAYFYSVSSVDVRRNESGRSEEASEVVP